MSSVPDAIFGTMVASSVVGLALSTALQIMPGPNASDFYVFRSIEIADHLDGEPIRLAVDREIKMDFQGRFAVTGRNLATDGWKSACEMTSAWRHYRAGSAPLGHVSLDWWTDGECQSMPVGLNEICTTITIRAPGNPSVTECSNVFRVWPRIEGRR